MMRVSLLILVCVVFLILQLVAANRLAIGEISPDFPLLFLAYFSLFRTRIQGTILGFFLGLLQDLFNPAFLGLNALTKSIIGYSVGYVGEKTVANSVPFIALVFFLSMLGHDLLYMLFFFKLHVVKIVVMFITVSIPSAVYTALIGVVVHSICTFFGYKAVEIFGKTKQ
jgi:rod shape-determining protein MreD